MADIFELQASLQKTPQSHSARYYGFLSGSITNVSDDQGLVRVKARIGAQGDTEESDWLIPAFPGSVECKPSKGDPCIVGFIDGDPNRGFWLYHPESTTKNRPTEYMVLGTSHIAMYNDLATKLNNLLSHYQALYAFVQSHVHAALGSPSPQMTALLMDPTAKDVSTSTGLGQASDGSTVASSSSSKTVLSGLCKVK